jgi:hypothetical protein
VEVDVTHYLLLYDVPSRFKNISYEYSWDIAAYSYVECVTEVKKWRLFQQHIQQACRIPISDVAPLLILSPYKNFTCKSTTSVSKVQGLLQMM